MTAKSTSRTSKAIGGTATSLAQFVLNLGLQIGLVPIIIKIAHPETLGAYAILTQFLGYVALLDLGLSATTLRFLAQAHGYDDNRARFSEVLAVARTALLATNVTFAIVVASSAFWLQHVVRLSPEMLTETRISVSLIALWGVIRGPWVVYAGALRATQRLGLANFIYMIGAVSRLLLSVGLLFAHLGLIGLVVALVISEMITTTLFTRCFRRDTPDLKLTWKLPHGKLLAEVATFSTHVLVINVSSLLIFSTDNLVVGFLYGAVAVSVYYSTQVPATSGLGLLMLIGTNSSPAINELFARGETEILRRSFLRIHKLTLLLALPFSLGVLLMNRHFIVLWVGGKQYAGNMMTVFLSILLVTLCVSGVNNVFVQAKGNIRMVSLMALVEGLLNLGASIWLGRVLGIAGVVLGTLITHLPNMFYVQWHAQNDLGIAWGSFLRDSVARPLILAIVAGLVLYALIMVCKADTWFGFGADSGIFVLIYGILCYKFGIEESERHLVVNYLRNKMVIFRQLLPAERGA